MQLSMEHIRMSRKKRTVIIGQANPIQCQHECHELIAHWIFTILIDMDTWKQSKIEYDKDNLRAIGLNEDDCEGLDRTQLLKLLQKQRKQFSANKRKLLPITRANLDWLQSLVGLNDVEVEVLLFAICISTNSQLEAIAREIGGLTVLAVKKVLATILGRPYNEIAIALSKQGNLLSSGLLKLENNSNMDLDSMLQIPSGISELLSVEVDDRQQLLDQFFYQAKCSELTVKDYSHVKEDLILLKSYLKAASEQKQTGVNILIYGEPGTGKTELVSVLAKSLNTVLYQISNEETDGESILSHARIIAYQMAQRVLRGKKNALLLFDEIEDIFPTEYISQRHQIPSKAWLNNLLENNQVPAFWLSNNIQQIDSAYIRRFDYVLELKTPPRSARKKIIKKHLGNLVVSEQWLDNISQDQQLVPGVISRAAKVISTVHQTNQQSVQDSMDRILNNTLRAMGKKMAPLQSKKNKLDYQLEALNPNYDIHQLLDGLQSESSARLCLYGPSGTGKTAFGHYISTRLDKPLLVRRASDILSPYVGVAEQNMAAMFEDAKIEGAVLLLDEADSFLQERSTLKQSWEVTQVNELLTQMEAFEGLFVCSTNLMDKLDAAALRRFDFKIKLDYLNIDQSWLLFCNAVGWDKKRMIKETDWHRKLSAYNNLTPGDFANVLRQNRLYNRPLTPAELMVGLGQESLFKKDSNQQRGIGFHVAH